MCLWFRCPAFSELYRETVEEAVNANATVAKCGLSKTYEWCVRDLV